MEIESQRGWPNAGAESNEIHKRRTYFDVTKIDTSR
jgi:hypothetical protein